MPRQRRSDAPPSWRCFDPAALTFLKQLKRNNRREWFMAHKDRYTHLVQEPMCQCIEELDVILAQEMAEIHGDPKRSMFRIYRDVRFGKDKSPYKTHAACWCFHQDAGRGVGQAVRGGAGLYLHLEPGASMIAAGIWMPPKEGLEMIREALLDDHASWAKIVTAPAFRRRFGTLSEEAMLVRLPRGADSMHPAAPWLRYKSFTVHRMLDDDVMTSATLLRQLTTDIRHLRPMVRWLNNALGFGPLEYRL